MRLTAFRRTLCVAALATITLGAQCSDSGGGTDPDPTPPTMALNGGSGQSAAVGTAVATAPSVKVTNATGQGVAGISVTFTIGTGGGQVAGGTQTTNSSGVATVTSWTMGSQLGSNTLVASAAGTTGGPLTFTATATAGPAKNIEVNAGNNQNVTLGNAVATAPSVKVTDAGGNVVAGTSVTFAIATGGGSITGAAATTNASGIATIGSWTPGTLGSNTITATSAGLTGSPVTFTATAAAGAASKLTVTTVPSATSVNRTAFSTQPVVRVQDANGNNVSQAGTVVTATITAGGGTLGGTATATTNASGIATFTDLSIAGTVGARTISFTATGLTAATAPVTTTAGAPATIAINAGNNQSATISSAVAVAPAVKVADADDNGIASVTVTFAVVTGGGSVTGGTATTNASGIATVGSWTLGSSAGSNTVTATATFPASTPSVTFTATATSSPATKVLVQTQPGGAAAGSDFTTQPVVRIADASNTTVTSSTAAVTVTVASGSGTLSGTTTVNAVAGVATFTNLRITGATGAHTLSFASAGLTSATSSSFTVGAGTNGATQLVITQQPAGGVSGAAFTTQPKVEARDAGGTVVTTFQNNVTATIASGSGTIVGTATVQALGGVATFTNLGVLGTGNHTIQFAATGLTSATSNAINVAAATPASVAKNSTDSLSAFAGAAVGVKPSVKVLTSGGQPAAGVTVTFAVGLGGGSVTGGTATTDAAGVATVGTWTMGATAGLNTVTATVSGSGITGNPITFSVAGCAGTGAGFKITVCFGSDMTTSQKNTFTTAAAKWESIVSGDLTDIPFSSAITAGTCGTATFGIPAGTTVDDLLIFAAVVPIDGVSGVLGNAGPCHTRNSNALPVTGSMRFDVADVANMETNGTFSPVILHEMGHVLGIGSLWSFGSRAFVTNLSPTSGTPLDTYYNQPNGLAGFNAIGGNTYTGGQKVPVENTGGAGTVNSHWRESVLQNELMTGFISAGGTNPLSILTVKSLIDLGYTVNEANAEAFFLTLSIQAAGSSKVHLLNDVYMGPLMSVDSRGRTTRIIRK